MKDTSITVRIDSDTKETLESIAKKEDRSLSYIVDQIIKTYLKEHPQEK